MIKRCIQINLFYVTIVTNFFIGIVSLVSADILMFCIRILLFFIFFDYMFINISDKISRKLSGFDNALIIKIGVLLLKRSKFFFINILCYIGVKNTTLCIKIK